MASMAVMLLAFMCLASSGYGEINRLEHPVEPEEELSFSVVGDWGRRGTYNQSQVAFQMGRIGQKLDINFVISTGDNFYDSGLTGVNDPAFVESFTKIYTAKSLQKPWYSVLGNHDYRGNAKAQLSSVLKKIDPRWICLRSFVLNAGIVEVFFVDTTPFVDKYFTHPKDNKYDWRGVNPRHHYIAKVLEDLELALRESTSKWKIVVGHHTIRSIGIHGETLELVNLLLPILEHYQVKSNSARSFVNFLVRRICSTIWVWLVSCSPIQFLTSGAGSKAWRGSVGLNRNGVNFYYDGQGFMSMQLTQNDAKIVFYDVFGNVLHSWNKFKPLHSTM